MENIVNIGVLGCANIAKRSVIPAIMELGEQFFLEGVASRSEETAKSCADVFDTKAYAGYQTLLDSSQLDAVYIPLPNALHAKWIEMALNRNIHVLVEKSLACKFNEVLWLNQLAKEKKLVLFENFQFRFHRQLSMIKQLVGNGNIGELRCVRSSFGFPPFPDKENIRYKQEIGGGALLDAGAYPVKIAQMFLGDDIEVKASSLHVDPVKNVDIWGGAYLQQSSGTLFAELAFGFDHHYQCNLELWGSKGKLTATRIFTAPSGYSPEILIETSNGAETITVDQDNHFKNMLMHVHRLITTRKELDDEYEQNIQQAQLLEQVKLNALVR